MKTQSAFTLIELLIVVSILAILAATAVPNFLEAQTRSKVSRVKSDMRALATALESYFVDNNSYPLGNSFGLAASRPSFTNDPPVLERLSTPVAYMTTALVENPFVSRKRSNTFINGVDPINADTSQWPDTPVEGDADHFLYRTYHYIAVAAAGAVPGSENNPSGLTRVLWSENASADRYLIYSAGPSQAYINAGGVVANADIDYAIDLIYDPTNGTNSFGNIWRPRGDSGDNIYGAIPSQ
jgi:prepilin-type N-terminal cleavage/methylation domain-containing protein